MLCSNRASSCLLVAIYVVLAEPLVGGKDVSGIEITGTRVSVKESESLDSTEYDEKALTEPTEHGNSEETASACGIWLAPSSIPGAGLGMFAGRDFKKDDFLQEGGDVVIPLVDLKEHGQRVDHAGDWSFLWDEYTWDSESLYMANEGLYEVNAASPGFGAAANCFLDLDNVDEWYPSHDYAGLHRSKDPGVGAFTPYHGRHSSAKVDIKAGEEFFVTYGNMWFESRTEAVGYVPLLGDLDKATNLAQKFHSLKDERSDLKDTLIDMWTEFVLNSKFNNSHVLAAFSSDLEELERLKTTFLYDIRREQSRRSLEWLKEHGTCGDNIVPRPSMLPQAGRGGFAARFLAEGTVVAQLPLIHISNRERLNMWPMSLDEEGLLFPDESQAPQGKQLLLNYCFGHSESSLLLCPYGPMANYVNHNKTLANVQLRWGRPERGNHMPELLDEPISRLESDATAKLAFEMIATRDIQPEEELYLDYGEDWENSWSRHVADWKPSSDAIEYVGASHLNNDRSIPLRTEFEELAERRVPENVELHCDMTVYHSDDWMEYESGEELETYLLEHNGKYVGCEILRYEQSDEGVMLYTVVMLEPNEEDPTQIENHLVEDIPREAIRYMDKALTSDIFLSGAFRHHIGIPDQIFPKAWRNRRDASGTE